MVKLTKAVALTLRTGDEVHFGTCTEHVGPRGGVSQHVERWRVNGQTKVWARSPERFHVPIKYGFKGPYSYVTEDNAEQFHLAKDCCPVRYDALDGTRLRDA